MFVKNTKIRRKSDWQKNGTLIILRQKLYNVPSIHDYSCIQFSKKIAVRKNKIKEKQDRM